jgi:transcriptional/translational regulatory protein YebC/TACO1
VRHALEAAKMPVESSKLEHIPDTTIKVGFEDARKLLKLIEMLEELEEVQQVYANFDIPDEILEKIASAD